MMRICTNVNTNSLASSSRRAPRRIVAVEAKKKKNQGGFGASKEKEAKPASFTSSPTSSSTTIAAAGVPGVVGVAAGTSPSSSMAMPGGYEILPLEHGASQPSGELLSRAIVLLHANVRQLLTEARAMMESTTVAPRGAPRGASDRTRGSKDKRRRKKTEWRGAEEEDSQEQGVSLVSSGGSMNRDKSRALSMLVGNPSAVLEGVCLLAGAAQLKEF